MARLDPFSLPRPAGITETKVFTDPLHPGVEIPVTLTVDPGSDTEMAIICKQQEYVQAYITGIGGGPAAPLIPIGGRSVKLSEMLFKIVAALETYETPPEGDEKYGLIQWLALSVNMPTAFQAISQWASDLSEKAAINQGN